VQVDPDHHCRHQHAPRRHLPNEGTVAGMPNTRSAKRPALFRATPRRDLAGWHIDLKPGTRPAGGSEPAHQASQR
jgi:hypothetical protein